MVSLEFLLITLIGVTSLIVVLLLIILRMFIVYVNEHRIGNQTIVAYLREVAQNTLNTME